MSGTILLCDLTENLKCTLAVINPYEHLSHIDQVDVRSHENLTSSIDNYLKKHNIRNINGLAISAPGWEENGIMNLTNIGFKLSRKEFQNHFDIKRVNLVNNFVAKALSVPKLTPSDFVCFTQHTKAHPDHPIAVFGPSYGLGMAVLMPDGLDGYTALASEGGHSDLAPTGKRECDILNRLAARFGQVSRERVLSFSGLGLIYETLCEIDAVTLIIRPSLLNLLEMADQGDKLALETFELFSSWLGSLASDCVLMFGARGGIYISSTILDAIGDKFNRELFLKRFADKGRMKHYVSNIPIFRITNDNLKLIGLSSLFEHASEPSYGFI